MEKIFVKVQYEDGSEEDVFNDKEPQSFEHDSVEQARKTVEFISKYYPDHKYYVVVEQ